MNSREAFIIRKFISVPKMLARYTYVFMNVHVNYGMWSLMRWLKKCQRKLMVYRPCQYDGRKTSGELCRDWLVRRKYNHSLTKVQLPNQSVLGSVNFQDSCFFSTELRQKARECWPSLFIFGGHEHQWTLRTNIWYRTSEWKLAQQRNKVCFLSVYF